MRTVSAVVVFAVCVTAGAYGVFGLRSHPRAPASGVAPAVVQRGAALGAFDPAISTPCRHACAASEPYQASDVAAQPGVEAGELTQCPVSGVVFTVDGERPHVTIETGDYVLCCDGCAGRFRKDPARYVSL
jgi:hypothetical protein